MTPDEKYMSRCIELARKGTGYVAPNPMVGCVIVCDGRIIGEGYHRKYGEPHAEVNAIRSVKDPELLKRSTLYVNLEPCSHYGKTPPCSLLIIEKQIPRVIVGNVDPFPQVSGGGIRMLKEKNIEVITGVLDSECRELNKRFFLFHEKKRPYIILKWAQSADGFLDKFRTDISVPAIRISNKTSTRCVHKLRATECSILVGTNTALLDNPSLTVREWKGNNPVRLVIDRSLKIPPHYHLLDGNVPTLIFTEKVKENNGSTEYVRIDFENAVIPQILEELYKRRVLSVIVEGGQKLLQGFINEKLWDEAFIEVAPILLSAGVRAPVLPENIRVSPNTQGHIHLRVR